MSIYTPEINAKVEATKGRRVLRKETLKPSSKLAARYGVYVDGKRVGAVGLTRSKKYRDGIGHWWPMIDGRLISSITFGSREQHAEWVIRWMIAEGRI